MILQLKIVEEKNKFEYFLGNEKTQATYSRTEREGSQLFLFDKIDIKTKLKNKTNVSNYAQ